MAAYQYIYVMKGLSKTFTGGREILKNIHLSFLPGAKIGVLGSNGAGKSTCLRVLSTIIKPSTGKATVSGFDVSNEPLKVREQIGVLPVSYTHLTLPTNREV